MQSALTLTRTTIGQKALVAVSGLVLFGFLLGHLAGNLQIYGDLLEPGYGRVLLNSYAEHLHGNFPLLWGTRIVLTVAAVTHIYLTMRIAQRNRAARGVGYKHAKRDLLTTYAARTMVLSGPIVLAYIVYHLLHFTVGADLSVMGVPGGMKHLHPYENLVLSFRQWPITAAYLFANILLGLHIFHGAQSAFQSIGASHPRYDGLRKQAATGLALFIAGGNCAIPISVMVGIVGNDI